MNKKGTVIVLIAILALVGGISSWWISQNLPLAHPEEGKNVAHAAIGDTDGCAECHLSPIAYTDCSDSGCHDAPDTIVGNNIFLKHHEEPDGCEVCHAAVPDDARYVVVPTSGHNFCSSCHSNMQHDQS